MKELLSRNTKVIFFNEHPVPIQAMLDFDWLCSKDSPCISAIVNPGREGFHKCFFGSKEITIPVFETISEAVAYAKEADVFINFASTRSAFESSVVALNTPSLRTIVIVAEGMPENQTRELIRLAKLTDKWIIGPSTVGAIKAGAVRVGYSGGSTENLIASKLYRPGSVGVITVSGGMSNEIYSIVSNNTDGVYEGVAVGGDTFPGSTLVENVMRLSSDPKVKMLVVLGEIGGPDEYEIAEALKVGKINKPLVAWVSGTVAELFPTEVQFGHAGARSEGKKESAQSKNNALREAGAFVPRSFNDLGKLINSTFAKYVSNQKDYSPPVEIEPHVPPRDIAAVLLENTVRKSTNIISSISDDRGETLTYNKKAIAHYISKPVGETINALWFQGKLNRNGVEFIELCLKLSADHGPAVATAHNTIVTARAGKDLVSSVLAGLLTIGPRHGGAINDAAKWIFDGVNDSSSPINFINEMKSNGRLIMGIGHRVKTAQNPDERVTILKNFASKRLKKTSYLDYALAVEQETLKKRNNLILNVDGAIAAIFLDLLINNKFSKKQIQELIDFELLNGIFVLGRSIGLIGHYIDQKRLHEPLYRHPWDDILYM